MTTARFAVDQLPATNLDTRAVATAQALAAHIVQRKGHGHAGTAMALAPVAHVLFSRVLRHCPTRPDWPGRDRFVLSAGHASLLLYTQLFFTGYGLTLEDLAASRSLRSRTPGHPEIHHTVGVEMSTGPLGQGLASAVGMAMAALHEQAIFTPSSPVLEHTIWALAGDGCLQEGVSSEASSLAGTMGLENLVVLWDDNEVTIDARTSSTFSEDVRARYASYGWRVLEVEDATDLEGVENVLRAAAHRTGRPTLVAIKTVIGSPSAAVGGTPAAHSGGFGEEELARVKETLGFSTDAQLEDLVDEEVLGHTRGASTRGEVLCARWDRDMETWASAHPEDACRWEIFRTGRSPLEALSEVGAGDPGDLIATRKTNGAVITALQKDLRVWGGSADLSGSTNVTVSGEQFSAHNPGGEFIRFGIREHCMAAVLNGIALHGPWRPFGSTYLVFSDYMRPSVRLAALMNLGVIYVLTHDSVAVGEDGPTHQPVEQIASLRTVPGLDLIRPADSIEVIAAWRRILTETARPVVLALSRQELPVLPSDTATTSGVMAGGYVRWQSGTGENLALIATGSEVSLAIDAARVLDDEGISVRVVSMPCVEWFTEQDQGYRDQVLPPTMTARVAIEAGRGDAWHRWTGTRGEVISIEDFGESGSGPEIMRLRGMHLDAVIEAAHRTLRAAASP